MEQRMNIKFCFKLDKTAAETYEMLKKVYGEEALFRSRTYEWFEHFRDGCESVEDDPHTGRPQSVHTPEVIEKVRDLVKCDRRLTFRVIANELNMDKKIVRRTLTQDLGKRKICSRFVPHHLRDEQKQLRPDACGELIDNADADPAFLDRIVTGDESWCYQYDPETKRQSSEWQSPSSPRQKKFRFEKSKIKVMLIAFFDCDGLIHDEFLPPNMTINGQFYTYFVRKRIRRVKPHFQQNGS
ncbi:protein GVQW3-like [Stegodyphus dumicola]|uniref:protein GVQW3-like n=1 Tax=Stegodyphus dumicola TaxID=202533 RepID=UPI0015A8629C|nr:protein GVQW3-like [Stegodyphus dumicola]